MNYNERLLQLRKKGILSDDQAERLSDSLEVSLTQSTPLVKKNYMLESIGIVLLAAVTLYLFIVIGTTDQITEVEDVAVTLNSATNASIGVVNSFILILILACIVMYGGLYLYAYNRFKAFVHDAEEVVALKEHLYQLDVMIDAVKPRLEKLLDAQGFDMSDTMKVYVMETLKELEERRYKKQEELIFLEAEQRQKKEQFPDSLAGLIGKLPKY